MKHTAKKKYNFHWAPHLGENRYKNVMKLRVGYDGFNQPWYLKTPKWHEENRYTRHETKRREYVPLTMWDLQRAIDLGRLDLSKPVDLCALQNAHVVRLATNGPKSMSEFGVNLVSQGADSFKAKGLVLEVQMADQTAINAIELAGSSIELAYYDIISKRALVDPVNYFLKGRPIDKRMLPAVSDQQSDKLYTFYSDPKKRGYLSNPEKIETARSELYKDHGRVYNREEYLKNFENLEKFEKSGNLTHGIKKHPRQIFFGLDAGMLVNIKDKVVFEPVDEEVAEFYKDGFRYGEDAGGFVAEHGIEKELTSKNKMEGKIHYVGEDTRKVMKQEEFDQWMNDGKLSMESKDKHRKQIK
jgi:large subunit ribosomal protein L15